MAAPTFIDITKVNVPGGGAAPLTATLNVCTNTLGDLLIVQAVCQTAGFSLGVPPVGWTEFYNYSGTVGGLAYEAKAWWKISNGSEGSSITLTHPNSYSKYEAQMFSIRGTSTPAVIPIVTTTGSDTSAGYGCTSPSITPTNNESLVVRTVFYRDNGPTFTEPSGHTSVYGDSTDPISCAIATATANAGATGTKDFTSSVDYQTPHIFPTFAFAPGSTLDSDPPELSSAVVAGSGARVLLTFNESVEATDADGLSLRIGTEEITLKLIAISGDEMTLEPSRSLMTGETLALSYDDSTGDIEDTSGNALESFTGTSVTNNSEATIENPPGWDDWIYEADLSARFHVGLWGSNAYNSSNAYGPTEGKALYEPWRFYRLQAESLGGDATLEAGAVDASGTWLTALAALGGGGVAAAQSILFYPDGLSLEWLRVGNATAKSAVITHSTSSYASDFTEIYYIQNQIRGRECAYSLLAILDAEIHCGEAHRDRLEYFQNMILGDADDEFEAIVAYGDGTETVTLDDGTGRSGPHEPGGHFEQVLGGFETDEDGEIVPGTEALHHFDDGGDDEGGAGWSPAIEGATAMWSLISIYENAALIDGGITPDARIIPKMRRLLDAIWQIFWVEDDQALKYRYANSSGSAPLNNFLAPCYWWFSKITGEPRHAMRGDLLFYETRNCEALTTRTGSPPAQYITKEFAELTRWIPDGREWREQALEAPASGQSGPVFSPVFSPVNPPLTLLTALGLV